MNTFEKITYEVIGRYVARIMLNRPDCANAQDTDLLYELNRALDRASHDDNIRVIILGAHGKHFSGGHDLREGSPYEAMHRHRTVSPLCCFTAPGIEGHMAREEEIYLGFCERWRNIPKPTIAAVQGQCVAGGLMLIWPCDIILASEDAQFCDPTLSFGIPGVEYFALPFEVGSRKARELLYTSDKLSAAEAHRLGMVNHVFANEALEQETLRMAQRIAEKSAFALKLAKQAVNQAEDAQGRVPALQQAFSKHQLAHAHNLREFDSLLDPNGLPESTQKALGR